MYRIRRFLTEDAAKTFVTSYILSRLDYCNCPLMNFRHTMVLFCVVLCFLIHPYLTICELFSPLSKNRLLIVYVVYLRSLYFAQSIFVQACRSHSLYFSSYIFRSVYESLSPPPPPPPPTARPSLSSRFLCSLNIGLGSR